MGHIVEMILEISFSSFLNFCGMLILLGLPFRFMLKFINALIRYFLIKKHGWPPNYLDLDGDFQFTKTDKDILND